MNESISEMAEAYPPKQSLREALCARVNQLDKKGASAQWVADTFRFIDLDYLNAAKAKIDRMEAKLAAEKQGLPDLAKPLDASALRRRLFDLGKRASTRDPVPELVIAANSISRGDLRNAQAALDGFEKRLDEDSRICSSYPAAVDALHQQLIVPPVTLKPGDSVTLNGMQVTSIQLEVPQWVLCPPPETTNPRQELDHALAALSDGSGHEAWGPGPVGAKLHERNSLAGKAFDLAAQGTVEALFKQTIIGPAERPRIIAAMRKLAPVFLELLMGEEEK